MRKSKKVIGGFLIAIIIFLVFLLPLALFDVSFVLFVFSKISYLIPLIVLSLLLSFAFLKNRTVGSILVFIVLLVLSVCMLILNVFENNEKEIVRWNSPHDRFTTDFVVGQDGRIYIKAVVNDTAGLFLFDTGCDHSLVNEKYVTDEKMKLYPYTLWDVKGIKQTKNLYKVKYFEFGSIRIDRMHVYPVDNATWIDPRGIHYKQDSVLGIIGNNFILKFIWDFDLIRKQVTVSKSKTYGINLHDSLAIHLVSENNHKDIAVQINGENKQLTLDFGSALPISISDSILVRDRNKRKGSFSGGSTKGLFNHLDTTDRMSSGSFADVKLGAYEFKAIKCFENDSADLLGIPFIWSFERVVLDFLNNKAYLIGKNDTASHYGVHRHNHNSFWNATGIKNVKCSPEGFVINIFKEDSTRLRYVFYGTVVFYNNNQLDSIFCHDSLRLPDGRMKQGPFTLQFSTDKSSH